MGADARRQRALRDDRLSGRADARPGGPPQLGSGGEIAFLVGVIQPNLEGRQVLATAVDQVVDDEYPAAFRSQLSRQFRADETGAASDPDAQFGSASSGHDGDPAGRDVV